MINPDLLRFIRSRQNEGMSRENITQLLIDDGDWTRTDIDEAFAVVDHDKLSDQRPSTEASESRNETYISGEPSQAPGEYQEQENVYETEPQPGIHTTPSRPTASDEASAPTTRTSSPMPFVIAAILLLLGGAGVAVAFFGGSLPFLATSEKPPEDIVERMFDASTELDSYSMSLEGMGTITAPAGSLPAAAQGSPEDATDNEVTVNATFSVNGASDMSDIESPNSYSTVSVSIEETNDNPIAMGVSDIAFELESRTIGDVLYINLIEAPNLGFFSLEPFENRWVSVDMANSQQVRTQVSLEDAQELLEDSREVVETLIALNEEHRAVDISYEGTERVEGHRAYHYHMELIEENVYDFLVAAREELENEFEGEMGALPTEAEVEEGLASLESLSADMYVSTTEFFPVRFTLDASIDDSESGASGNVTVTNTISNFNEPVNVETPEDASSVEEVMMEMFGGEAGGGMMFEQPGL